MEKMQRFVKNDFEGNMYYNYFSEHRCSGRSNDGEILATQRSDFNFLPHCPASEIIGFKTNNRNFAQNSNTETLGSKNYPKKEPGSFNYRNPKVMIDEGFSNKITEYTHQNNNLNENGNVNYTRNYEGFPMNYRNEDQLSNNTLFSRTRGEFRNDKSFENSVNDGINCNDAQNNDFFRSDTLQRNEKQFGGNVNTIPGNSHVFNNNFGPCSSMFRNYKRISNDIIGTNEHQFQTNSLAHNKEQPRFGNVDRSHDQFNIYDSFSRDNVNDWKFGRNTNDEQHLQRLDDGFQCVLNPEFFPLLCKDDEHFPRDIGNEEDNAPRGIRRNRSSSRGISEEHKFGNGNRRERYRRSSSDDHHTKGYGLHKNKYSKVNTTHDFKNSRKYLDEKDVRLINPRRASFKKDRDNNLTDDDIPLPSRYSSTKRLSNRIDSKRISYLESRGKQSYTSNVTRKNDFSSSSKYPRMSSKPRSELRNVRAFATVKEKRGDKIMKAKSFLEKSKKERIQDVITQSNNASKVLAKTQKMLDSGILNANSKCRTKSAPEKYWKKWWSKFAYIETVIEKVDADDKSVKEFIKFHYDLNKANLDRKVWAVFTVGVDRIKQTANISETNYESRVDVYKTLKYKKLLEDKDFQTFLLPLEQKTVTMMLQSLKNNKNMLALLYQSIIYRWHISRRLTKSEESGSVDQVKLAGNLLNDKLFQYLVYDSIRELKKLTTEDWPGFEDFYKNLQ